MEGEAFDPSPQSSIEREGKESEDVTSSKVEEPQPSSSDGGAATQTQTQTWQDKVQPVVRVVQQGTAAAQSRLQPLVNHPYVQKSTEYLSRGVEQVSSTAGRTTGSVSNSLQPVVGKAQQTVQMGRETARKIYNKEEGYEPGKVAARLGGALGILFLLIFVTGWSMGDGRSKYNVDVTNIVAEKVLLPNGRHFAYVEQGASKEEAKHNVLFAHGLLSSRLLGLSGVDKNLLKKYGVRLVAYDRPGIGQSDPHLKRNLNTSAEDMADIADALGMGSKFWVFAHGEGAVYAWAALHYIPTRLAGVAMFGPFVNPYAKNTTKEESKAMWADLGPMKSRLRYARHFPSFVPGKFKGIIKKVNKYMKNVKKRVNSKDKALMETDAFGEAWERAIRESVRSGDPKPHAQDLVLQAQNWGFQLSDIRAVPAKRSLLSRIFLFWRSALPGFSGPIHIFHGTEDKIAPLVMSEYVKRLLPQVELHRLEGEGHFSWFFNCPHCHRELFKTLFGEVEGLEELDEPEVVPEQPTGHTPEEPVKYEKPVKVEEPLKEAEKIAPVEAQVDHLRHETHKRDEL